MPAIVLWSAPRGLPLACGGSRRSRLAASQTRACAAKESMSMRSSVTSWVLFFKKTSLHRLEPPQLTQALAVPGRVPVERGIGRQPAQIEMLVVLPGVADSAEDL